MPKTGIPEMYTEEDFGMQSTEGMDDPGAPRELPLDSWHRSLGGRMVDFAGYWMPLQFEGIVAEHQWTRDNASLFDVSHMGQILVSGATAVAALERLLPADLSSLRPGRIRYSLLLDDVGGILDDLMVTRVPDADDSFYLVVNGANVRSDLAWLGERLAPDVDLIHVQDRALLALQGPRAADALDGLVPGVAARMGFMDSVKCDWRGNELWIGRCGYTGEDGFEISLPSQAAAGFADALLADDRVKPAGLGARDSLRLEAGLPLHGHDIDRTIDPVSAALAFALSKRRRDIGGFPGHDRITRLLTEGPAQRRVGLAIEGRLPAREGAAILRDGFEIGRVTSGGFSPTLGRPIAMGYVAEAAAAVGTSLEIDVRGRRLSAAVVPLPFVAHLYHRPGVLA